MRQRDFLSSHLVANAMRNAVHAQPAGKVYRIVSRPFDLTAAMQIGPKSAAEVAMIANSPARLTED
jgi:hypothetical protein